MNITRFALTKRTVMSVLLALALIAGTATYLTMPRQEDPGFTVRAAVVTAFYPGATTQEVENLVTDPLEKEIGEIPELEFVTSESRSGAAVIQVEVEDTYSDVEPIWTELRERVQAASSELPRGVIGPRVNDNYGDRYSTVVAMTGDDFSYQELDAISEEVRKVLLSLRNVGKVKVHGIPEQRVYIEYDRARMAALGLSTSHLMRILQQRNVVMDGGYVQTDRERIETRPTGSFDSLEQIRSMTFRLPASDEVVALRDVADVNRGYEKPPTRTVSYNGSRAVSIAVSMADGGKITELGPRVLNRLEEMQSTLPAGLDFHTVSYRASVVDQLVSDFTGSLIQGILAVLAVMLLFLGTRTGTIVATAIPTTIIGSLLFMAAFDISLNKMSLTALIIALGLLVDNAIVISESILVQMREGKSAFLSAIDSVRELRFPLLVSSLTTAAALLPTYLSNHVVAEYTSAIFEVVTIALLFSWGVSLTVMPMLCYLFLEVQEDEKASASRSTSALNAEMDADESQSTEIEWWKPWTWPVFSADDEGASGRAPIAAPAASNPAGTSLGAYETVFYRRYRSFLKGVISNRWLAIAVAGALLATSLYAAGFLPKQFIPRKQETIFKGELEMPYGTPFHRTQRVVSDLETFMADSLQVASGASTESLQMVPNIGSTEFAEHGVLNWATWVGSGAPRYILGYNPEQPRPNYAYMLVNTTSYEVQEDVLERMNQYLERSYPDVMPRLEKLRNGPPLNSPIEIRLSGTHRQELREIAGQLKSRLRAVNGVINVRDDWGERQKRLYIDVDDARAQRAGLTNHDVGLSVRTSLTGVPLTAYREGNNLIPVMLRSQEAVDRRVDAINGLDVYAQNTGRNVPLSQVADFDLRFEPSKILRRDRKRTITVQADLADDVPTTRTPFSVVEDIRPWLDEQRQTWPFGYTYAIGGEPEQSGDARGGIAEKAPYAVLFIILLLVAQFNSIRKALIVLLTLPFALIGVVLGLSLANLPFDFMGILGVIALLGIVINNAVVLIDRIDIEIEENGFDAEEAVIQASQRRLRPILLTTATTICGLVPLWITGDVMFTPMAVSMIFGLLVSTLLTLGLVPLLYALLYRLSVEHVDTDALTGDGDPGHGGTGNGGSGSQPSETLIHKPTYAGPGGV